MRVRADGGRVPFPVSRGNGLAGTRPIALADGNVSTAGGVPQSRGGNCCQDRRTYYEISPVPDWVSVTEGTVPDYLKERL